jgi:glycerol-3-phosphate dehydrogenase
MPIKADVLIIGGGIAGTSIAQELSRYELDVILIEKEADLGWGQTKASYAIRHPGARWAQPTLAQRMMARSHRMWDRIKEELDIELAQVGELVLAFNEAELRYIHSLKRQGEENGVEGLEIVDRSGVRRLEPHVNPAALAALHMPTAGVFNPFELVFAFSENARANGVSILADTEAIGVHAEEGGFIVQTTGDRFRAKYVVNAAGLHAARVAKMAGADDFAISSETKSTCLILDRCLGDLVNHVVTGVADPGAFSRFKLVMPTFNRNLLLYTPIPEPAKGIDDRALVKRAVDVTIQNARFLIPDIDIEKHIIASFSTLAARNDRGDFVIEMSEKCPGLVNVALPPPGITCSPAIGKRVAEVLEKAGLSLFEKPNFNPYRRAIKRVRDASFSELRELVAGDPERGHVVCRCEKVSEGEIIEAIRRGATTADGIKFRTRAGMGRCQSNYCGPEIAAILASELHLPFQEVTKKGRGSEYILG